MSTAPRLLSSSSAYDPSQLQQQQQPTLTNSSASTSSSSSSSSSLTNLSPGIIITLLILSVTIILTTSLCLLFRHFHRLPDFLSLRVGHRRRHGNSSDSNSESSSRQLSHRAPAAPSPAVANQALIDSLPLFSFSSVTRRANAVSTNITTSSTAVVDADCAVCLSRFVSQDTLRLLPLCCHAFHSQCIDTWLSSGRDTCPLCRSNVYASAAVPAASILRPPASSVSPTGSFRLEIGSVSRRRNDSISDGRRSFSIGSFDYVVEADSEVAVTDRHRRSVSDKDDGTTTTIIYNNNSSSDVAELILDGSNMNIGTTGGGSRSWLGEYMDRLSATLSSRTASFRSSRRFFTGSSRRSEVAGVGEWDIETSRVGEEISELFRWASGV